MQGSTPGISRLATAVALVIALALPAGAAAGTDNVTSGTLSYVTSAFPMPTDEVFGLRGTICQGATHPISAGFETNVDPGQDSFSFRGNAPYAVGSPAIAWVYDFDVASTRNITFRGVCAQEEPKLRSAAYEVGAGNPRTASVMCPRNRHVYGGGGTTLASSFPFDSNDRGKKPDDGWKVASVAGANGYVSVWAFCGKTVPDYNHHAVTVTPASGTTSVQGCGDTPAAIGGGHKITGDGAFLTQSIVSNPDSFNEYSATVENDGSQDLKLTVYSICGGPGDFG